MAKISINLLPVEFTRAAVKDTRFYKIQFFGVGMILLLILLSSLTVALSILQSQRLKSAQILVNDAQQRVTDYKDKQSALVALKNRLTAINQYTGVASNQSGLFNLMNTILPSSVFINNLSIDRSGNVSLSVVIPDNTVLDKMINDLTDKSKNKGKISQVSIEGLSQSKDGLYRLNLRIKP